MLKTVGAGLMVKLNARVALRFAESVTRAVNSKAPAAVGVPEITPLGFSPKPGANVPEGALN
jgi:hypothetical protein